MPKCRVHQWIWVFPYLFNPASSAASSSVTSTFSSSSASSTSASPSSSASPMGSSSMGSTLSCASPLSSGIVIKVLNSAASEIKMEFEQLWSKARVWIGVSWFKSCDTTEVVVVDQIPLSADFINPFKRTTWSSSFVNPSFVRRSFYFFEHQIKVIWLEWCVCLSFWSIQVYSLSIFKIIFRLENALRIQNTQVEKYIFKSWVSDNTFSGGWGKEGFSLTKKVGPNSESRSLKHLTFIWKRIKCTFLLITFKLVSQQWPLPHEARRKERRWLPDLTPPSTQQSATITSFREKYKI